MDVLVHIHLVEKPTQLFHGISIRRVFRKFHLLFYNGAHQTFRIAILPGSSHFDYADLDSSDLQACGVDGRGILHPLIGMMDLRSALFQRLI